MRDIERYLNIRSAFGASFAPDGTLAFLMDTTGVPQVWTLEEACTWPEQRTFYDERVLFGTWSPARHELVFGMDEGGNERAQLYRLDADGSVENLTRLPDAKHRWGGWSHDGERFAFVSNRRDEAVFDVYVQDRDATGDDARLVHETDGWFTVGGWSPEDDRLVLSEARSNFDQDVYVLDVETGDRRHLTPREDSGAHIRFQSLSWGPDGEAIYCVTDHDSDTLSLGRLATDGTGDLDADLTVVEEGGDWNVDGVALDDETGRLVYSRNVDGYTELTTGELDGTGTAEITEYPDPDLPAAVAGGVAFDDEADRFAITVTGDTMNSNVYVVDIEAGESERWTRASTAGIPRESFRASDVVRYETFDERVIPALFTLPDASRSGGADVGDGSTGDDAGGSSAGEDTEDRRGAPVIVDIHGGPESQRRPSFSPLKQYFLANGYAVFEPNVRGSTGYGKGYTHLDDVRKRTDAVRDIERAVAWLADHPAVDEDRIVALGGSYGGFMVLAAMTEYPDLWAAGVDIVGIANFVTFLENTGDWRRELREAEYGSLADDREFLEEISPLTNAERIRAPLFVLHGANDPRVPVEEAEQIVRTAGEHVPVEKLVFEDEGHGISKLDNRIEAYSRVVEFLDEHVGES